MTNASPAGLSAIAPAGAALGSTPATIAAPLGSVLSSRSITRPLVGSTQRWPISTVPAWHDAGSTTHCALSSLVPSPQVIVEDGTHNPSTSMVPSPHARALSPHLAAPAHTATSVANATRTGPFIAAHYRPWPVGVSTPGPLARRAMVWGTGDRSSRALAPRRGTGARAGGLPAHRRPLVVVAGRFAPAGTEAAAGRSARAATGS